MSRRSRESIAAFFVVLAIAAHTVPEYGFAKSQSENDAALVPLAEVGLMVLLGTGLVALSLIVRRPGYKPSQHVSRF